MPQPHKGARENSCLLPLPSWPKKEVRRCAICYARHGMAGMPMFGVSTADLKFIAKTIKGAAGSCLRTLGNVQSGGYVPRRDGGRWSVDDRERVEWVATAYIQKVEAAGR